MNYDEIVYQMVNEIIKIIEKKIKKTSTKMISSVITDKKDDKYVCTIDGVKYEVKNGTNISFKNGDKIWICRPNGSVRQQFIFARR